MIKFVSYCVLILILGISSILVITYMKNDNIQPLSIGNIDISNNLQQNGVEIINQNDPSFNSVLMEYTGGRTEIIPYIESARPFVLFIKNNSERDIVGVSLRWNLTTTQGENRILKSNVITPGVLMGLKPRDPWMAGKTSLIKSNTISVFSYFNPIKDVILNIHKSYIYKRFEYQFTPEDMDLITLILEDSKKNKLKDVSNIAVSIDGIIFNDGSFMGENKNYFFEISSGLLQAKRDFVQLLKQEKGQGKKDTEILDKYVLENSNSNNFDENFTGSDYINGKQAFDKTYQRSMRDFVKEIRNKRQKSSDTYILNDFLTTKESDLINLIRR